jgi:hypothetical protein
MITIFLQFFFFLLFICLFPNKTHANRTHRLLTHSHNDYHQKNPLMDALSFNFDSIEADIWLSGNQIIVSHMGAISKGSLKDLYLDPLQKRVNERASVYGDGRPFFLWLDIKDGNINLIHMLHDLLDQYPMLTVFTDTSTKEGPVSVILTGHEPSKIAYVNLFPTRKACRDSNSFKIYDPSADQRWLWYSLQWSELFRWNGYSKIKTLEVERLHAIVEYIHKKRRKVRFWDTPENREFWELAKRANVDMIGTDKLKEFSSFTRSEIHNTAK